MHHEPDRPVTGWDDHAEFASLLMELAYACKLNLEPTSKKTWCYFDADIR